VAHPDIEQAVTFGVGAILDVPEEFRMAASLAILVFPPPSSLFRSR
jgi:hypothetical protein